MNECLNDIFFAFCYIIITDKITYVYVLQTIDFGQRKAKSNGDLLNVANALVGEFFPQSIVSGEAPAPYGFHEKELLTFGQLDQLLRLLCIHRQRLLAQHVLTRIQHHLAEFQVRWIQRTDVDHLCAEVKKTHFALNLVYITYSIYYDKIIVICLLSIFSHRQANSKPRNLLL